MNTNMSKIFVLCIVIGVLGIGAAAAAPTVIIDPASTPGLAPNDTFPINISVDPDGNGVASGEICLSFDASVLEVTDLVSGDMLGADLIDLSEYDNAAGTIDAIYSRKGATTPPTPAGTWATITFQVKAGVADCTTDIGITSAGLANEVFVDILGITTTDGTATIGAAGPTLTVFTVEPATVAQGETVDIDTRFSEEVSWVINVNNSTDTVRSWDGTSTNPDVKHWETTTETPTGDYTVDVFMNGALVGTKSVTVSPGVGTPDTTPPNTAGHDPAQDATGIPIDTSITVHVLDAVSGVNISTIVMTVNGTTVTPDAITGAKDDYTIVYTPPDDFGYDQLVNVTINASDLNGTPNVMTTDVYSFTTGSAPVPTSFVILDPADGTVGTPITVTVEVRNQYDDLVATYQDNVTLNASGSATGDGLVNIVNGTGSLDISDTVAETVTLSLNDTEETDLDVTSTWVVTFAARDNGGSSSGSGGGSGTYPPGWGEPAPTSAATPAPTAAPEPTVAPTEAPTVAPTEAPTKAPTVAPTETTTTKMKTEGTPGFGAVLTVFAIAGLLVAAYLVMRRRE